MYAVATDTGPPSGSLVRRQSLPRPAAACDASLSGDGDADGLRALADKAAWAAAAGVQMHIITQVSLPPPPPSRIN